MKWALVLLCLTYYASAQNLSTITNTIQTGIQTAAGVLNIASLGRSNYHNLFDEMDEDVSDTGSIILGYKYPVEEYSLSTDDGYILKIFRIPCKKSKNPNSVLLMPDFYTSSDYWVLSGPKYGLPFYLADLGYDVWLGNNRGGKYGQKHKMLKKKDSAFWQFSVHEWGFYDLPAIIDFIIGHNKCEKISYIGWGYGATQFFVMASEKPKYMAKIKNMQALGPHVYLDYTRSRIKLVSLNVDEETLYEVGGRDAPFPNYLVMNMAGREHCLKVAIKKEICNYIEPIAHEGFYIDIPGYPEIACKPLIQGSIRFYLHVIQSMKKGFRKFDHGMASNLFYYGRECPPKYNIKAADVPIALYYSEDDNIAVAKDVLHLSIVVPKLIRAFKIKHKHFGFLEFLLSKVGHLVYYKWVAEVLSRYNHY